MSAKTAKKLSQADLHRHRRMFKRLEEAQQIQQQINALTVRRDQLLGAWQIYREEVHEIYGLTLEGNEGVMQDGSIVRASALDGVAPPTRSRAQRRQQAVEGSVRTASGSS